MHHYFCAGFCFSIFFGGYSDFGFMPEYLRMIHFHVMFEFFTVSHLEEHLG